MAEPGQQEQTDERPLLAIGLYIGALLALYGLILLFYGWLGAPNDAKSLGHPFDIWWGAVTLAVGAVVWGLAFAGKRSRDRATGRGAGEPPHRLSASRDRDEQAAA